MSDVESTLNAPLDEAIAAFRAQPDAPQSFGQFLDAYTKQPDEQALELCWGQFLSHLSALDPSSQQALSQAGYKLSNLRHFDKALVVFLRVAEMVPNDPRPHNQLGYLYQQIKDGEKAKQHYRQQAELLSLQMRDNPSLALSRGSELVHAWVAAADTDRAFAESKAIIENHPDSLQAYLIWLGVVSPSTNKAEVKAVWPKILTLTGKIDVNTDANTLAQYLDIGHNLQRIGLAEEAISIFKKLSDTHPEALQYHTVLANIYRQINDTSHAHRHSRREAEILTQQIQDAPERWENSGRQLIQAWANAGEPDQARQAAQQILHANPGQLDAVLLVLASYQQSAGAQEALSLLPSIEPLIENIDNGNYDKIKQIAQSIGNIGLQNEAIKIWERLLSFKEDDAQILSNLASTYNNMGRIDSARAFYRRRAEINSRRFWDAPEQLIHGTSDLVSTWISAGDADAALREAENLIRHFPNLPKVYGAAFQALQVSADQQQFEAFWTAFQPLLELLNDTTTDNGTIDAIEQVGHQLQNLQRHAEAITVFTAILKIRPDSFNLYNALSNLMRQTGDTGHSRQLAQTQASLLAKQLEDNPLKWANLSQQLVEAYFTAKQPQNALATAVAQAERHPDLLYAYVLLFQTFSRAYDKDNDKFSKIFEKHWKGLLSILNNTKNTEFNSLDSIISNIMNTGRFHEAIFLARHVLKIDKYNVNVAFRLAEAYKRQGNPSEYKRTFHETALALEEKFAQNPLLWRSQGNNLVTAWLNAGNPEAAMAAAEKAITFCPDEANGFNPILQALAEMDDDTKLLNFLDKLISRWPDNASLRDRAASLHLRRGDRYRAMEAWGNRTLELNSNARYRDIQKAKFLPPGEAESQLVHLADKYAEDVQALEWVYSSQRNIHDVAGASTTNRLMAAALEKRLQSHPEDGTAWTNLGHCFNRLENTREERRCYRRALELNSKDVNAANFLAGSVATTDPIAAIGILDDLIKADPTARFNTRTARLYSGCLQCLSGPGGQMYFLAASLQLIERADFYPRHTEKIELAKLSTAIFDAMSKLGALRDISNALATPQYENDFAGVDHQDAFRKLDDWHETYEREGSAASHLRDAVGYAREAVALTAEYSPRRAEYLSWLARLLFRQFNQSHDEKVLREAMNCCRDMIDRGEDIHLCDVMTDALSAADTVFAADRWAESTTLYEFLADLGERLRQLPPQWRDKAKWLKVSQRLASRAAFAWWRQSNRERAVVEMERGLATLIRDELQLRDLDETTLRRSVLPGQDMAAFESHLADFLGARTQWLRLLQDRLANTAENADSAQTTPVEQLRSARDRLNATQDALGSYAGLETLFRAPNLEIIQSAARPDTPLVYVLYTCKGGLALIVDDKEVSGIELPELSETEVERHLRGYLFYYRRFRTALAQADHSPSPATLDEIPKTMTPWLRSMDNSLEWLWPSLMRPLVDHLRRRKIKKMVLVGGGLLRVLPLGAVWRTSRWARLAFRLKYLGDEPPALARPRRRYAIDLVCTRIAPSALSLVTGGRDRADAKPNGSSPLLRFRWKGAGRQGFQIESDAAARFHPHETVEISAPDPRTPGTKQALVQTLREGHFSVLQFSGHGQMDADDPLGKAGLLVDRVDDQLDWLNIRDILQERWSLQTCILSSCESGLEGRHDLPHEAIGLPAALLQAGITSVIAPHWCVSNSATAHLISAFHQHWQGAANEDPAEALRQAQIWLRRSLTRGETAGDCINLAPRQGAGEDGAAPAANDSPPPTAKAKPVLLKGPFDAVPPDHPFFWAAFTCAGG